jgi:uncharacterized membrane protein YqaE (UPF0057 family)
MRSNTNNLTTEDPDDYIFVSNKNYARKRKIQDGNGDVLQKAVGRPGPITGIVLAILDGLTTLIVRFSLLLLQISSLAFDFTYNHIFGNFNGIIPSALTRGKVISLKWFRYAMTIMMPPFGVFLSKGIYGWFNILVCLILTYINYVLGIVYAFVITMRNRYADQFEDRQMMVALANNPPKEAAADIDALLGSVIFLVIICGSIAFMLHYF